MRPRVVVLDYGSGNLRSAERALIRVGADVVISADQDDALECDGLLVPGVGAFAACMSGIREVGADQVIDRRVSGGRGVLGVCVGMQVMFQRGEERGSAAAGLGQWSGAVSMLDAPILPHLGWDTLDAAPGSRLLAECAEERFYFVHSYAAKDWTSRTDGRPMDRSLVSWGHHGEDFIAAVESGPLCGVQFHPEKSGDAGAAVLDAWVSSLR